MCECVNVCACVLAQYSGNMYDVVVGVPDPAGSYFIHVAWPGGHTSAALHPELYELVPDEMTESSRFIVITPAGVVHGGQPSSTPSPTATPSKSLTPSRTSAPSPTPSGTNSAKPSSSMTPSASLSPSPTPSVPAFAVQLGSGMQVSSDLGGMKSGVKVGEVEVVDHR